MNVLIERFYIFPDSRVETKGEIYFTARCNREEYLICFHSPRVDEGLFCHLEKESVNENGDEVSNGIMGSLAGENFEVKIFPTTYNNLLTFDDKIAPRKKLRALNKEGYEFGMGTGNRVIVSEKDVASLADISCCGVFEGIFNALSGSGVPNWFIQQSIMRELIPESINHEEFPELGHTGGYGPRELLRAGLFAFFSLGGYNSWKGDIGADADHAIINGNNSNEFQASMQANKSAIREARDFTKFTVDTCALFDFPEGIPLIPKDKQKLVETMQGSFNVNNILSNQPGYEYVYTEEEVLNLSKKYWQALQAHAELYEYIKELKNGEPFDYELSLDETEEATSPKELWFYLKMLHFWYEIPAGDVTSVAPSVGFSKRSDYEGNLDDLFLHVNECASIAHAFGASLCIHSGSGEGVITGKGDGVDEVLAEATEGKLQLKVSGIYQEILWRTLADSDIRSERKLFEKAWESTYQLVKNRSDFVRDLDKEEFSFQFPQATDYFFRHHSFRIWKLYRKEVYQNVTRNTWREYSRRVMDYTRMRVNKLGLDQSQ